MAPLLIAGHPEQGVDTAVGRRLAWHILAGAGICAVVAAGGAAGFAARGAAASPTAQGRRGLAQEVANRPSGWILSGLSVDKAIDDAYLVCHWNDTPDVEVFRTGKSDTACWDNEEYFVLNRTGAEPVLRCSLIVEQNFWSDKKYSVADLNVSPGDGEVAVSLDGDEPFAKLAFAITEFSEDDVARGALLKIESMDCVRERPLFETDLYLECYWEGTADDELVVRTRRMHNSKPNWDQMFWLKFPFIFDGEDPVLKCNLRDEDSWGRDKDLASGRIIISIIEAATSLKVAFPKACVGTHSSMSMSHYSVIEERAGNLDVTLWVLGEDSR